MFNLFGRKPAAPPKPAAAPQSTQSKATPPSNGFDQMEVIGRCIERFMDHNTFVGGLDAAPGFRAQIMPNGIQVASNRDKRIGVFLDKNILGISVAGVTPITLGASSTSVYFKHYHKHEPKWQVRNGPGEPQIMDVDIPFGSHNMIHIECKEQLVDTQFDGKKEPGCTLMFTVQRKAS